ncbi:bifunctional phosphoribosyl-AMP cyclohydrolase/phosphoribosyl-ATP diphosphatase HisIE [Candidatus Micrarchaeota archaeon]|nr:bifunctional phosphoribosyl-AMP cyclohydrolase/phosphoribosyl-ATP diphosphatase HisIE [Candidatus Micrarchaeota archaeon]
MKFDIGKIKFDANGLVPLIVQDADTSVVLSLFYANKDAVNRMLETNYVWRYSRKLGRIIKKGEQSRNYQKVISLNLDCDSDAILVKAIPEGPACHTGEYSCFDQQKPILNQLIEVIKDRKLNPKKGSYTSTIVNDQKAIIAKLREESEEFIEAGEVKEKKEIVWEAADLLFFMLVYLENRNIKFSDVLEELNRRRNPKKN